VRLGLNIDQVRALNPPDNPVKNDDVRTPAYVREFGDKCWELDALEPRTIQKLITDAVLERRDEARWQAAVAKEAEDRQELREVAANHSWKSRDLGLDEDEDDA